jgi:WD40 repeat protein
MSSEKLYDVFLSHNSEDKPSVERVAHRLVEEGNLDPWLDRWNLVPGEPWQEGLEEALDNSKTCAVFIGPIGISPWQNEEMRSAIQTRVDQPDFRVIPVLLPGAVMPKRGEMPRFLSRSTWVDFRVSEGVDNQRAFKDLIAGILGIAPGRTDSSNIVAKCPYRGLEVFDELDAKFFFGREAMTQQLVEAFRGTRFLAVIGSSGSGKSSLVRAGLLSKLKAGTLPFSDKWTYCVFKPGGQPLERLAVNLTKQSELGLEETQTLLKQLESDERSLHIYVGRTLSNQTEESRFLIVIDQFEELFTLCREQEVKTKFINSLRYAATVNGGQTIVVITMRADFLPHAAQQIDLAELLSDNQFIVSPVEGTSLREIIEKPAQLVGLNFERGLVEEILDDVGQKEGALPLLEDTLLQLCENRNQYNTMTLQAYHEIGGVKGALAKRANKVFNSFTGEQKIIARRILLRLTYQEGPEETKLRAHFSNLITNPNEQSQVESVIKSMADARLLTTRKEGDSEPQVEVAHEAVIREWPLMRQWLEEIRDAMREPKRISEAADQWRKNGKDPSFLLRGARLAQAQEWRKHNEVELNTSEREFLDFSVKQQQDEQRALKRRWLIIGSGVTVGLVLILLVVTITLYWFDEQRRARSRSLAASAASQLMIDPELSTLLAIEAVQNSETDQAVEALRRAVAEQQQVSVFKEYPEEVLSVAYSPDGTLFAAGYEDNTVLVGTINPMRVIDHWTAHQKTEKPSGVFNGYQTTTPFSGVNVTAFDPTGQYLLTAGADGDAFVWAYHTREKVAELSCAGAAIRKAGFVAGGNLVFTISEDKIVRVWNWRNRFMGEPVFTSTKLSAIVYPHVAVSSDGQLIAGATFDSYVEKLWDDATKTWIESKGRTAGVAPDFSPFSLFSVKVWNSNKKDFIALDGLTHIVGAMAFSHDSQFILAADDEKLRVWNTTTGAKIAELNHDQSGLVNSITFSNDDKKFITASDDKTAKIWDTNSWRNTATLTGHSSGVEGATFSPDGRLILTRSSDRTARIWLTDTAASITVLRGHQGYIKDAAFAPDNRFVITSSTDKTVRIWKVPIEVLKDTHTARSSPDGKYILTVDEGGATGLTRIWERSTGQLKAEHRGDQNPFGNDPVFSTDGQYVVLRETYAGFLWNWTRETGPTNPKIFSVKGSNPSEMILSPDNKYVITTYTGSTSHVWDAQTGGKLTEIKTPGRSRLSFSNDGQYLAISNPFGDKTSILKVGTWEEVQSLAPQQDAQLNVQHDEIESFTIDGAASATFSPDSKRMITWAKDKKWRVWDVGSWRVSCTLPIQPPIQELAFDPTSRYVVMADDVGIARVWDAGSCSRMAELRGHSGAIASIAFSRDGAFIVTTSYDLTAKVWETVTGQNVFDLRGHKGVVKSAEFGPETYSIITTSPNDNTALIFKCDVCLSVDQLLRLARKKVTRELTADEKELYLNR